MKKKSRRPLPKHSTPPPRPPSLSLTLKNSSTNSADIKYKRVAFETEFIEAMLAADANLDQATNPEMQQKFQVDHRIEEIKRKAAFDWLSHMVHFALREPASPKGPLDWLSADENALLTELTSTIILMFYWIQDLGHPSKADAAIKAFLANFPEQQLVATLRARAAQVGIQLRAPA